VGAQSKHVETKLARWTSASCGSPTLRYKYLKESVTCSDTARRSCGTTCYLREMVTPTRLSCRPASVCIASALAVAASRCVNCAGIQELAQCQLVAANGRYQIRLLEDILRWLSRKNFIINFGTFRIRCFRTSAPSHCLLAWIRVGSSMQDTTPSRCEITLTCLVGGIAASCFWLCL